MVNSFQHNRGRHGVNSCAAALLCLLIFYFAPIAANAAKFTAAVDRKEPAPNEPVIFTLSLTDSDTRLRAEGVSPNVDLSVLTKDFNVGTPRAANRYNISEGRGRSTSSITVELFPRRSGRLRIPAFAIDGMRTSPIALNVRARAAGNAPEVFVRAGVNNKTPWAHEQVIVWLDVHYRATIKNASMGDGLSTEPVRVELIEHRKLPASQRTETVNGITYNVSRAAWALYPKESGALTVHLPDVWVVLRDERKLRLPAQNETLEVLALPAHVPAGIPVGIPEITRSAPQPTPAVNTVSTWTVTVRGPWSGSTLPEALPLAAAPANLKLYSDRARREVEISENGLTSVTRYTLSALPRMAGEFTLPPVRVPYFDPARGVMDVAGTEAAVFTAAPAISTMKETPANTPLPATAARGTEEPGARALWRFSTAAFAALWLVTLLLWWKQRRPRAAPRVINPRTSATPADQHAHPLQTQLLAAFGARTLEQGLLEWENRHGADAEIRAAVRAVQGLCYGGAAASAGDASHAAVTAACAKIRAAAAIQAAPPDPWRPESFAVDGARRS